MPFQASRALGGRGVYLGREMSGSAFCYDPFELAEQSVLTGPAMIVLGEIGKGKSSLVKAYLHRQVGVFGRRGIVISPKRGEYDRLAASVRGRADPAAPWRHAASQPARRDRP